MTNNLFHLIEHLSDGQLHSGADIGRVLGITRSAIWKLMPQLADLELEVESAQGKGYQLNDTLRLLDEQKIMAKLTTANKKNIHSLLLHPSVSSTNDCLDPSVLNKAQAFQFCLAEHLTAARGRLGRPWYAPYGQNIYLSCAWLLNKDISTLSGLSLVVGLACVQALQNYGFTDAIQLKWPNDLYYQGKKLGGVLIETTAENHGHTLVTIGIGLNVNMLHSRNTQINQAWTSLRHIDKQIHDRNLIAASLINTILQHLADFTHHGFKPFIKQWQQHDYFMKKPVKLINAKKTVTGTMVGINEQGNVLLKHQDGSIAAYSAGDVSLRDASV